MSFSYKLDDTTAVITDNETGEVRTYTQDSPEWTVNSMQTAMAVILNLTGGAAPQSE